MRVALDEFLSRVNSIERNIDLRDQLVAIGRVPPGPLDPTATALHRSVTRIGLSGLQPSLDGSILLLTAAFEQFVSDLIIAFTANLPDIVPAYGDLPSAIRSANERLTGEALGRSRSRFTEYDRRLFVQNLGDCQSGAVPYVLNGTAIALTERSLNAGRLTDLFSRLGIPDIWTVAASTRSLKRWSGRGGAKTAESRAKGRLKELIDDRNQIAHRVGGVTLGPETIRTYLQFERTLARSLVKGLENYASTLARSSV